MQKKELLSQSYEYQSLKRDVDGFSFQTIYQLTYEIIFKSTPYLFSESSIYSVHTYEFSIILVNNPMNIVPPLDNRIAPTIAAIFSDFYENAPSTIAIYICDSSDGRQEVRQRKFSQWFDFYRGLDFVKIDAHFKESDGTRYPVSLIIKESNPFRVQIFEEFLNVVEGYNVGK